MYGYVEIINPKKNSNKTIVGGCIPRMSTNEKKNHNGEDIILIVVKG